MTDLSQYMTDPPNLTDFTKEFLKQSIVLDGLAGEREKLAKILDNKSLTIESLNDIADLLGCEISWIIECAKDAMLDFEMDIKYVSGRAARELLFPYVCAKKAWAEYSKP